MSTNDEQSEQRELDEFISLLAHDLRTPLTSIRGYAQLLRRQRRDQPDDDPVKSGLGTIIDQADRLAALTELLLDVSRIRLGRLALRRTDTDVGAVAGAALAAQPNANARLEAPDQGPIVNCDSARVQQIVGGLVRYLSPLAGERGINVRVEDRGDSVGIAVETDTVPLSAADADGLLRKLVDRALTASGWQLAHPDLYIARGAAEAHGGSLTVESPIGSSDRGIRLTLTLPK